MKHKEGKEKVENWAITGCFIYRLWFFGGRGGIVWLFFYFVDLATLVLEKHETKVRETGRPSLSPS